MTAPTTRAGREVAGPTRHRARIGRALAPRRFRGVAAVFACASLVWACSGTDDSSSDVSTGSGAEADHDAADEPADATHGGFSVTDEGSGARSEADTDERDRDAAAPEATTGDLDGMPVENLSARTGRRLVRSARLELDVEDPAAAADRIARIAEEAGGFVAETDLERELDGTVRGSLTLRVPSAALFATVEELDALAVAVPVRRIDERDVTAESTDLQAQLTNLTAYEIELRALLAEVRETTTRPDDLLIVFERIRSVRAEIDQAEARLALLDDQVALSTISVALRPATSAVPVLDPTWVPSETVREALTTTARALSNIADVAIRFTLTVLPVGLLLGTPAVVAVIVWRRVRGDRTPPAATPPAMPAS